MSYEIRFNNTSKWFGQKASDDSRYLIHLKTNPYLSNVSKGYAYRPNLDVRNNEVSKFGNCSLHIDHCINLRFKEPLTNNDDFTMCYWLYMESRHNFDYLFSNIGDKYVVYASDKQSSNRPAIGLGPYPYTRFIIHQNMINTNVWTHVALIKYNNLVKLYIDGVESNGYTSFTFDKDVYELSVGVNHSDINWNLAGYADDISIIKGTALWTSNFTPPSDYLPDKW